MLPHSYDGIDNITVIFFKAFLYKEIFLNVPLIKQSELSDVTQIKAATIFLCIWQ